jgi:hypothetical protein
VAKPRIREPRPVTTDALRNQHVFQCSALAADFQVAVGVAAFEVVVQVDEQTLDLGIVVDYFFRKHQDAALVHTGGNPGE